LKLGEKGAWVETAGGVSAPIPPLRVDAVDTTAAGDCFNGVFAANLCLGKDPVASAKYAVAAAAIAVSRVGAQPSMPTAAEVQAMLERDGRLPFQLPVDL
jgi:ribokinase